MGLCGSKGAEPGEPTAKGANGSAPAAAPEKKVENRRKSSVVDAIIHTSEIPREETPDPSMGRTRFAKPRMRDIEVQRLKAQRRERANTVAQQEYEEALQGEDQPHLKKLISALNVFKVEDAQERRDIIENYRVLDAERQGSVATEELALLAETLDFRLDDEQVLQLTQAADPDRTGRVRPREFVRTLVDVRRFAREKREEMLENFRVMDEENQGFVALDDLKELMGAVDERCTPELVERLVRREGMGADGIVSEDEFLRLMQIVNDGDADADGAATGGGANPGAVALAVK